MAAVITLQNTGLEKTSPLPLNGVDGPQVIQREGGPYIDEVDALLEQLDFEESEEDEESEDENEDFLEGETFTVDDEDWEIAEKGEFMSLTKCYELGNDLNKTLLNSITDYDNMLPYETVLPRGHRLPMPSGTLLLQLCQR